MSRKFDENMKFEEIGKLVKDAMIPKYEVKINGYSIGLFPDAVPTLHARQDAEIYEFNEEGNKKWKL